MKNGRALFVMCASMIIVTPHAIANDDTGKPANKVHADAHESTGKNVESDIVCKKMHPPGTRFKKKKYCWSKSEKDKLSRDATREVEDTQTRKLTNSFF